MEAPPANAFVEEDADIWGIAAAKPARIWESIIPPCSAVPRRLFDALDAEDSEVNDSSCCTCCLAFFAASFLRAVCCVFHA